MAFSLPNAGVFRSSLDSQLGKPGRLTDAQRATALAHDYVLFGGILSDYLRHAGYFSEFSLELQRQGVPASQIHLRFPPSIKSIEDNAVYYFPGVTSEIVKKSPRSLVIIAHSKGAVEVVDFLLRYPEFARDHLEAVYLVQGAFGGSPLVDFIMKEYDRPGVPPAWWPRAGMQIFKAFDKVFHRSIAGMECLSTAHSQERLRQWMKEKPEALAAILPKLIFISTSSESKKMDMRLRVGGDYLKSVGLLENDGALGVASQSIPHAGAAVVHLKGVDHGLPCGNLLARRHTGRARSVILSILHSIGH